MGGCKCVWMETQLCANLTGTTQTRSPTPYNNIAIPSAAQRQVWPSFEDNKQEILLRSKIPAKLPR